MSAAVSLGAMRRVTAVRTAAVRAAAVRAATTMDGRRRFDWVIMRAVSSVTGLLMPTLRLPFGMMRTAAATVRALPVDTAAVRALAVHTATVRALAVDTAAVRALAVHTATVRALAVHAMAMPNMMRAVG